MNKKKETCSKCGLVYGVYDDVSIMLYELHKKECTGDVLIEFKKHLERINTEIEKIDKEINK